MVFHVLPIKEYFLPGSPAEARRLLTEGKGKYSLLGGGTGLAFSKPKNIHAIVDLSRTGLDYVKERTGGIHLGSGLTISELNRHPLFSNYFGGMVREAATSVATTPLRNLITVGGNVMQVYLWSCLPVLFLGLGAKFKIIGGKKKRTIGVDDFFARQPGRQLAYDEILKEVVLPCPEKGTGGAFIKFSKTKTDFALLMASVALWTEGGLCRESRVVLGAASPMPMRLKSAEEVLKGSSLSREIIKKASLAGVESFRPLRDYRVKEGYREKIAPILVERCLSLAAERAFIR